MRIVCPNCTSQYEVSEEAIPETGRDVQCAKCSEIWFQDRPMQLGEDDALLTLGTAQSEQTVTEKTVPSSDTAKEQQTVVESEQASVFRSQRTDRSAPPTTPADSAEPINERPRPTIDPEVQRILREEAAFAQSATAEPAPADAPETNISDNVNDATSETQFDQATNYVQEPPTDAPSLSTEEVAPQIDADGMSRVMQELDGADSRPQSAQLKESVTIASARSLREILEAEAIDPVDVTDGLYAGSNSQETITGAVDESPVPIEDTTTAKPEAIEQHHSDTVADAEVTDAVQPIHSSDNFLGDLGKRPVQIQHPEGIETELDDDLSEKFEDASEEIINKPLIRPASDLIKSASSLLNRTGSEQTKSSDDTENNTEAQGDVEQTQPDIPLAANSQNKAGRAVFTDIDELNSSLDIDTDEDSGEEIDIINLDEDDLNEPTNRFSMGFLAACGIAVITTLMYMFAPTIGEKVPATQKFMSDYEASIHNGRMVLQDMYYQGGEPGFNNLLQNAKTKFLN